MCTGRGMPSREGEQVRCAWHIAVTCLLPMSKLWPLAQPSKVTSDSWGRQPASMLAASC